MDGGNGGGEEKIETKKEKEGEQDGMAVTSPSFLWHDDKGMW